MSKKLAKSPIKHGTLPNPKLTVAVCALIFDTDNRILSVSRKNNPNDFGLIGGKKEDNETLIDALYREVKEETGLDIVKHTLIYELKENNYLVYTFLVKTKGSINTSEKGIVQWLSKTEIDKLLTGSFGKYNKELFKSILENKYQYNYDEYVTILS